MPAMVVKSRARSKRPVGRANVDETCARRMDRLLRVRLLGIYSEVGVMRS